MKAAKIMLCTLFVKFLISSGAIGTSLSWAWGIGNHLDEFEIGFEPSSHSPEPATILALCIGVIGLIAIIRKRLRK